MNLDFFNRIHIIRKSAGAQSAFLRTGVPDHKNKLQYLHLHRIITLFYNS